MQRPTSLKLAFGLFVLVYFVVPQKAYAYLDPGTGSYIIQVAIATLAGGTYLIFAFWGKIKTFLTSLVSRFFNKRADEADKGNEEL